MAKVVEHQENVFQQDHAVARVGEEELSVFPNGLNVPHDAMYVMLDSFEGPLDLLLHLVRKNNLNILDFRIAEITAQYISYVELMSTLRLKRAGAYLLMAATLLEIKSRALLPLQNQNEDDPVDQELELRRRLVAYEHLKRAAEGLNELPRLERDNHLTHVDVPSVKPYTRVPEVEMDDLLVAFADVMSRARLFNRHQVNRVKISLSQRILDIEQTLRQREGEVPFSELFKVEEGVASVITSFMAILELVARGTVRVKQESCFDVIHVSIKV